jgi:hypothetical protein
MEFSLVLEMFLGLQLYSKKALHTPFTATKDAKRIDR